MPALDRQGQVPLGLVVLKAGITTDPATLEAELIRLIREQIGAIATPRMVRVTTRLPKTRSGKILRASLRRLADGQDPKPPPTIDDVTVLTEIAAVLEKK